MASKFGNLLLHSSTKKQLEAFAKNPSHALLITGPAGSGKTTTAKALAAELLDLPNDQALESYPYFFLINTPKGKQDIPIESVREVISALKLKTPGRKTVGRLIYIEGAENLSIPAQNALLKILEEPSLETVFILTATSGQSVLPTISSRTQQLSIQPASLKSAKEFWNEQYEEGPINSAWRLSHGGAGLLSALLSEDKNHPLKLAVEDAKSFLHKSKYERLLAIDKLSKDKQQFINFLDALGRTVYVLHHNALNTNKAKQANALLNSRKTIITISDSLKNNANAKLAGLQLVLSLKV